MSENKVKEVFIKHINKELFIQYQDILEQMYDATKYSDEEFSNGVYAYGDTYLFFDENKNVIGFTDLDISTTYIGKELRTTCGIEHFHIREQYRSNLSIYAAYKLLIETLKEMNLKINIVYFIIVHDEWTIEQNIRYMQQFFHPVFFIYKLNWDIDFNTNKNVLKKYKNINSNQIKNYPNLQNFYNALQIQIQDTWVIPEWSFSDNSIIFFKKDLLGRIHTACEFEVYDDEIVIKHPICNSLVLFNEFLAVIADYMQKNSIEKKPLSVLIGPYNEFKSYIENELHGKLTVTYYARELSYL